MPKLPTTMLIRKRPNQRLERKVGQPEIMLMMGPTGPITVFAGRTGADSKNRDNI